MYDKDIKKGFENVWKAIKEIKEEINTIKVHVDLGLVEAKQANPEKFESHKPKVENLKKITEDLQKKGNETIDKVIKTESGTKYPVPNKEPVRPEGAKVEQPSTGRTTSADVRGKQ